MRLFAGRNRAPKHGDMDAWDDIAMLVQWRDLKDPLLAWWDVDPGILLDFERIRPVAPELAARRFIARYECLASGASRPADRRIVDAANALPSDGLHSRPEVVTYTHRLVDPFDVAPGQIDIRDIARGLSRMPRFAGHTIQPYSVAQHSIFVARNSRRRLLGLLHDATESYIIDLARPVKAGVDGYALMERRLGRSIYEQLGVRPPSEKPPCVQRADALSAAVEQRDLMNAQGGWWRRPEIPDVPELQVSPQHAVEAQFVEIFYELRAGRNPFLSDSPWPAAS